MQLTIRAARVNRGFTQEKVAKELGVSKKTVSSWEKGKTMPRISMVEPLCNLLNVKYDDIKWIV